MPALQPTFLRDGRVQWTLTVDGRVLDDPWFIVQALLLLYRS